MVAALSADLVFMRVAPGTYALHSLLQSTSCGPAKPPSEPPHAWCLGIRFPGVCMSVLWHRRLSGLFALRVPLNVATVRKHMLQCGPCPHLNRTRHCDLCLYSWREAWVQAGGGCP